MCYSNVAKFEIIAKSHYIYTMEKKLNLKLRQTLLNKK